MPTGGMKLRLRPCARNESQPVEGGEKKRKEGRVPPSTPLPLSLLLSLPIPPAAMTESQASLLVFSLAVFTRAPDSVYFFQKYFLSCFSSRQIFPVMPTRKQRSRSPLRRSARSRSPSPQRSRSRSRVSHSRSRISHSRSRVSHSRSRDVRRSPTFDGRSWHSHSSSRVHRSPTPRGPGR